MLLLSYNWLVKHKVLKTKNTYKSEEHRCTRMKQKKASLHFQEDRSQGHLCVNTPGYFVGSKSLVDRRHPDEISQPSWRWIESLLFYTEKKKSTAGSNFNVRNQRESNACSVQACKIKPLHLNFIAYSGLHTWIVQLQLVAILCYCSAELRV